MARVPDALFNKDKNTHDKRKLYLRYEGKQDFNM
jgi:hypothetical protein